MSKRIRVAPSRFDSVLPTQLRRYIMGFESFAETAVRLLVSRRWKSDRDEAPQYDLLLQIHRSAAIPRLLAVMAPLELESWVAQRHNADRSHVARMDKAQLTDLATRHFDADDFRALLAHTSALRETNRNVRVRDVMYVGRILKAELWVPSQYHEEKKRLVPNAWNLREMRVQVSALSGATMEITVGQTVAVNGSMIVAKSGPARPWTVWVSDMRTFKMRRLPRSVVWRAKVDTNEGAVVHPYIELRFEQLMAEQQL